MGVSCCRTGGSWSFEERNCDYTFMHVQVSDDDDIYRDNPIILALDTPTDHLPSVCKEYYFRETKRLPPGGMSLYVLDQNVWQPVTRFATLRQMPRKQVKYRCANVPDIQIELQYRK